MKKILFLVAILLLLTPVNILSESHDRGVSYRVVVFDIEAEHLDDQLGKKISENFRKLLCDEIFKGSLIFDTGNPDQSGKYPERAKISCGFREKKEAPADLIVTSSIFKVDESTYLLYSKAVDGKTGAVVKSKSIEHRIGEETLEGSVEELVQQITGNYNEISALKQSFLNRKKWHKAAVATSVASILLAGYATYEYNRLSSANSNLKTRYLQASSQDDIDAYKRKYNDNADEMETYQQVITVLYITAAAAIGWEVYLLRQTWEDSRDQRQRLSSRHRFQFQPLLNTHSRELGLSLSYRF